MATPKKSDAVRKRASPAKRPVTRSAVAKAAGVSKAVVSSFFSGRFYGMDPQHNIGISLQTQEKIVAAARRLKYLPENPALRLRLYPDAGDYCFLLNASVSEGIANPYFSRMVNGMLRELNDPSRQITYGQFQTSTDYLTQAELLPSSLSSGAASKFVLAGAPNYSLLTSILQRGLYCVYLSRVVPLPALCSVAPDYAEAARVAVRNLVSQGHRRIAFGAEYYFLPSDAYNKQELVRGCAEAMKEAGLAFSPDDVLYKPQPSLQPPNPILDRLLRLKPRPTAIFCFDDFTAIGVMRAAVEAGLTLPADLSVIGCNNEQRLGGLKPALSTVHFPAEEMGAMAVRELARMVRDGPGPGATIRILPVQLIERESVAKLG